MKGSLGPRMPMLATTGPGPWLVLVLLWGGVAVLGLVWVAAPITLH
ncbi:hypothetical protein ACIBG8_09095 [Nonomuraea sp. NPDC050556]